MLSMLAGAAGGGLSSSTSSSASGQTGDITNNAAFSVGGSGNATGTAPTGLPTWWPYALAGGGLLLVLLLVFVFRRK